MAAELKIGVIMDPLESIDPKKDSSLVIMHEACLRGHEVFYMQHSDLFMRDARLSAHTEELKVAREAPLFTKLGRQDIFLDSLDVIFIRKDPPFDSAYLYLTHLLEFITKDVWIINNPASVRSFNEKLTIWRFAEFIAPSLVTSSADDVVSFQKELASDVVLKPLGLFGGEGIERLRAEDATNTEHTQNLINRLTKGGSQPIMVQKFLDSVYEGDKRIILIHGEPLGAVLRVPSEGSFKANLHMGGSANPATIEERDLEICSALKPFLLKHELELVGVDIIGGTLTEINVTSPTCFQEIEELEGIALQAKLFDFVESRYTK